MILFFQHQNIHIIRGVCLVVALA